jgi:hypothetical protein
MHHTCTQARTIAPLHRCRGRILPLRGRASVSPQMGMRQHIQSTLCSVRR